MDGNPDVAPTGLSKYFTDRAYPRLARRGPHYAARVAGFQMRLILNLTPMPWNPLTPGPSPPRGRRESLVEFYSRFTVAPRHLEFTALAPIFHHKTLDIPVLMVNYS
jgi:hypothetical protein